VVVVEICGFFEPGDVGLCCDFWVTGWLFWWVAVGSRGGGGVGLRWAVDLLERSAVVVVVIFG
jgi:hypothetical protein